MPDIQIEKESKFKKLKASEREELAATISRWWTDFHNKRQKQIDTALSLQKLIYLNQEARNKTKKWKSNIKENKIYTTWDSMKSSMWKEIWSNEEQMFDVVGTSKKTEEIAEKQKEAIVHALKQMEAGTQFDIGTENWGQYGEFIYKTDWKKRIKKVKRFDQFRGFVEVELPLQENANIEAINPMFFNFDVTKYKYGDEKSWASCPKIFKRFASVEEIKNNPLYTFTKEQELDLDNSDEQQTSARKEQDNNLARMIEYGGQYEVLYLQGDIKFNGTLYKNIVAEVFAGRYLIYFEENPVYICPFVWDATQIDPETGRGISPLKSVLEMCKGKEELVNLYADIAQLKANPPHWGNDSFLKEKYKNEDLDIRPGKYYDYENSYNGSMPQPMQFDSSGVGDVISLLANDISDASSINANVMGNIEQGKRTATELQLSRNGSDARIAMKLDKIYQINLKVIENVAELLAMFKDGSEILFINEKGQRTEVEITNAIRQAQYSYVYEDRNAMIDRRQKFQEAFSMLNAAGNNPELAQAIDWKEALKTGLEMTGFDNPDKFFKDDTPIDKAVEFIKHLPAEYQQAIMQNVQPMLQQAQMMIQQQGVNREGAINEQGQQGNVGTIPTQEQR